MGWVISVHKEENDPVHIDVSGEMTLDERWHDYVRWLYGLLINIGEYDDQSRQR